LSGRLRVVVVVAALVVEVDDVFDDSLIAAGLACPPHATADNINIEVASAAAARRPPAVCPGGRPPYPVEDGLLHPTGFLVTGIGYLWLRSDLLPRGSNCQVGLTR
jgi:hypothetical protein